MPKKLFIDAAHQEEVRVVILDGDKLEEYDYETASKKQLKGNIYLAKVTRVEPSLQAAFVDYGGNRQGFLAFSEIHPDYYRIPVSDRSTEELHTGLIEGQLLGSPYDPRPINVTPNEAAQPSHVDNTDLTDDTTDVLPSTFDAPKIEEPEIIEATSAIENAFHDLEAKFDVDAFSPEPIDASSENVIASDDENTTDENAKNTEISFDSNVSEEVFQNHEDMPTARERKELPAFKRYRIQEVIKRRQILLIQVTKEERGNKGAALTTYISLPGRYCVLMPNTDKDGGGISRKINDPSDRKKLKEAISDLEVEDGMSVIVRTAGSGRSKSEIKRDFEALIRLWENIRNQTLNSTAPSLVFEEGDLIRRALRDLYSRDVDEIIVEGDEGYKNARNFMRLLIPSHTKKIQLYKDKTIPLFHHYHIEEQIASIDTPIVQLPSGGYLVINQTEALVAIDVNSGRSTRERNIEETALRTNLEAAEEIARQLRLRDLGGLIVIDFIDMGEHANQHNVEKKLKDSVRFDRARIQIGRISQFGLMEMSRQRLRPSVLEMNSQNCEHCGGVGTIRSVEARALKILRAIEADAIEAPNQEMQVILPAPVALYIFNEKRNILARIEEVYRQKIVFVTEELMPYEYSINRIKSLTPPAPAIKALDAVTLEQPRLEFDSELEQPHHPPHPAHLHKKEPDHPRKGRRDKRFGGDRNERWDRNANPRTPFDPMQPMGQPDEQPMHGFAQPFDITSRPISENQALLPSGQPLENKSRFESEPSQQTRNHPRNQRQPRSHDRNQSGQQQFFDLSDPGSQAGATQASELLLTDEVVFTPPRAAKHMNPNVEPGTQAPQISAPNEGQPTDAKPRQPRERTYLRRSPYRTRPPRDANDTRRQPKQNLMEQKGENIQPQNQFVENKIVENKVADVQPERTAPQQVAPMIKAEITSPIPSQKDQGINQETPRIDTEAKSDTRRDTKSDTKRTPRDRNTGDRNTGDRKTGDRNSRDRKPRDNKRDDSRPPKPAGKVEIISSPVYQPETAPSTGSSSEKPAPKTNKDLNMIVDKPATPKKGWWSKK
ncbi:MAG: Rne/Rng family ribonuclease [Alphaproteobacteria bacterium]|nr:Rne/Rng family ribonuclease [Alphaproteobacteria bacterium]